MPGIPLHTAPVTSTSTSPQPVHNPFPSLLQTPSGLALLEIQGTIHAPIPASESGNPSPSTQTNIGRLEFPLYDPLTDSASASEGKWMKKVYLYVGKHQRLVGEVKKLPKAMALIRKRERSEMDEMEWERNGGIDEDAKGEDLEIAEIVRWKIIFGGRPEPVGGELGGDSARG